MCVRAKYVHVRAMLSIREEISIRRLPRIKGENFSVFFAVPSAQLSLFINDDHDDEYDGDGGDDDVDGDGDDEDVEDKKNLNTSHPNPRLIVIRGTHSEY